MQRRSSITVFTFHRLVEELDPLFPEYHTQKEFDQIVGAINKNFEVVTLLEALKMYDRHSDQKARAVITFDDGYLDNHQLALPILEKHGLRASFYISTAHLNGKLMFSDLIAEAIRTRSGTIDLSKWNLPSVELESAGDRVRAHRDISQQLKYRPSAIRDSDAFEIFKKYAANSQMQRQMMNRAEVLDLATKGMEIGSHTHHHIIFSQESSTFAADDISNSKAILEDVTNAPVVGFAYPNGKQSTDFTSASVELVKSAGFEYAATTDPEIYVSKFDKFRIPRTSIWHRSSRAFNLMLLKHSILTRLKIRTNNQA